jgi:ABC-2 type transport system permease protein
MAAFEFSVPGFATLLRKELLRFWKVGFQTVAAPVLTSLLYLLVFSQALRDHVEAYPGVSYNAFLVPGLVMMAVLQNAFANASSSLIQSKVTGNLVFVLLPPLAHSSSTPRTCWPPPCAGLVVGAGVLVVTAGRAGGHGRARWALAFAVLGARFSVQWACIGGIWAEKFDQMAAFQNFVVMPLTFLSGVFYSTHALSPFWLKVSHLNPFFYMVDGFRYGFFGVSDVPPGDEPRGGRGGPGGVRGGDAAFAGARLEAAPLRARAAGAAPEPFGPTDRPMDMVTPDDVKRYIAQGLPCEHLQVAGDGRHFEALIVSAAFDGKRPVQRHQLVYAALGERMREEIHALSMKTLTPAEWQAAGAR